MKYVRSDLDDESEVGSSAAVASFHSDPTVSVVGPASGSNRGHSWIHRLTCAFSQRSYFEKVTLVALFILTLVVLTLSVLLYNVTCPKSKSMQNVKYVTQVYNYTQLVTGNCSQLGSNNSTCTHPVCIQLTASLLSNMNEAADPCEDFYEFACGRFRERVAIPPGRQHINVFSQQSAANEILLRSLLESSPPRTNESTSLHANTSAFYWSCMNESARELHGVRFLLDFLAPAGPWAALNGTNGSDWNLLGDDLIRAMSFSILYTDSAPFFNFGILTDSFNSTRRVLHISQPGWLLLRDDYVANRTENLRALADALLRVARLFRLEISARDVDDIIQLERRLAVFSLSEAERRDPMKLMNFTIKQVIEVAPCVNWISLVSRLLQNVSYTASNDTPVNLYDRPYFSQLCPLFKEFAAETQLTRQANNYLLLRAIWSFLPYLTAEAEQIAQQLHQTVRGIHGTLSPWQRCVKSTSGMLGFQLGRMFVGRHFRDDSRATVLRLIDGVAAAFNDSLAQAAWMDSVTRGLAVGKLNAIQRLVGYPDYFDNATAMELEWGGYNLLPDRYFDNVMQIRRIIVAKSLAKLLQPVSLEFGMTPQSVNAYYSPTSNAIAFPAGILQEPFYRPQFPAYIFHGAIGSVIGHEVTHGFDDSGRNFDPAGNRRRWWSNRTGDAFDRAAGCIARQYENFTVDGDVKVDGKLVLGESIADNGGLKAAFRAYQRQKSDSEQLLPYLGERYSKEQLLFVAYAQIWCDLTTPLALRQLVTMNPHPPGHMRVWGPVSNSPEFAKAFGCKPGARMNPRDKCVVW